MSNPSSGFAVRVEHLPDRRYRLWLQLPGGPLDLGISERTRDIGPDVQQRVAAHAGIPPDQLGAVDIDLPAPPYARTGQPVLAYEDDGRWLPAYVVLYAQGGFHLDTPEGIGIYPPEEIDFDPPAEAMTYLGRHRE
ncbi:hypothetical protein [Modestobacter italicus]|uniref:hypothetical protein n=1 Tax=Modestobacter italicus (strain DSM 44449 / CECT 9708 / BC 501) TaxID=2732864 RepID=UPI001C98B223|nr:hypothetical protein [Modestobacter italicus]